MATIAHLREQSPVEDHEQLFDGGIFILVSGVTRNRLVIYPGNISCLLSTEEDEIKHIQNPIFLLSCSFVSLVYYGCPSMLHSTLN